MRSTIPSRRYPSDGSAELTRNGTAVGTPGDYVQVSKQGPLEIQVQILDSAPAGSYELELEIPLLNGEEPVLSWSFKL